MSKWVSSRTLSPQYFVTSPVSGDPGRHITGQDVKALSCPDLKLQERHSVIQTWYFGKFHLLARNSHS